MSHYKTETILPCLTDDRLNRRRHKILELINVEEEIATTPSFALPAHGSHLNFVDDDHAKELRIDIANESLTKIHEKNLSFIHALANIKRTLRLTDDIANEGIGIELSKLCSKVRDHLSLLSRAGLCHLVIPERSDDRILDL